jgi:D-alanine transaminase/branched-chain amino acid aminotransferase
MSKWVYLNDEFLPEEKACLHVSDLSIQRGYGIFDFFKIINGKPVFLEDHLNRFYQSAKQMQLTVPKDREELSAGIFDLMEKNDLPYSGIKITLTGGYSPDGYALAKPNLIISQHIFPFTTQESFDKGIKLITYSHQRQLPQVKTIDYLMAIWLQSLIKEKAADDVLYHINGVVTECPRANFFIVTKNNELITPANNILKGITRMKVLEFAAANYTVHEKQITIKDIQNASEAFITSSTKRILPVVQVGDYMIGGKGIHTVTSDLYKQLLALEKTHLLQMAE